jgi:hypothetical protein
MSPTLSKLGIVKFRDEECLTPVIYVGQGFRDCLKTVYGAGFQPFFVRALLPGASPQADMDRDYGAFKIIILQQLKRQRRDAIPAWGEAPGTEQQKR